MKSNYKRLGDYINRISVKNSDNEFDLLLGINIDKYFMPSVANVVGTDLSKYKIVKPNQFACNRMHVGRDMRLPIALSQVKNNFIVSPAYDVFEIIDINVLNPKYLMMWFSRAEFDRNCWFYTDTDVRGKLGWDSFSDMKLPIPDIKEQNEIVKEYNIAINRIKLNEQLNQKLEETAQTLYKHWFVDFEFPNENGKPYKSSGGKMVYNEELEKEIPNGWEIFNCEDLSSISAGGDKPNFFSKNITSDNQVPIFSNSTFKQGLFGYTNEAKVFDDSITISARGGIGHTELRTEQYFPIVRLIVVKPNKPILLNYLYLFLSSYSYNDISSAQSQLTIPDVSNFKIPKPSNETLKDFQIYTEEIYIKLELNRYENKKLQELQSLLLAKMTQVAKNKRMLE